MIGYYGQMGSLDGLNRINHDHDTILLNLALLILMANGMTKKP